MIGLAACAVLMVWAWLMWRIGYESGRVSIEVEVARRRVDELQTKLELEELTDPEIPREG